MVDDIRIVSIDRSKLPLWATESTLEELKDIMKSVNSGITSTNKFKSKEKTNFEKTSKLEEKRHKESNKWYKSINDELKESRRNLTRSLLSGDGLGALRELGQGASSLLSKIPVIGIAIAGAATLLGKTVGELQGTYENLIDYGYTLNGSMFEIMKKSAHWGMTFDKAAEVLTKYSETISVLTLRVGDQLLSGADAFGRLNVGLRSSLRNIGFLGFSFSELTEFLGDYLEQQKLLGLVQGRTDAEQIESAKIYIEELTQLSKITNKSRKAINDQIKTTLQSADVQARLMAMSISERAEFEKNLRSVIGTIGAVGGPELVDTMKNIMVNGTAAWGEMGRYLMGFAAPVADAMNNLRDVSSKTYKSEEERQKALNEAQKRLLLSTNDIDKSTFETLRLMSLRGDQTAAELVKTIVQLQNAQANIDKIGKTTEIDKFYVGLRKIDEAWQRIKQTFQSLMGNVFEKSIRMMENITGENGFLPRMLQKLALYLETKVLPWIEKVFSDETGEFFRNEIKELIDGIFDNIDYYIHQKLNPFSDSKESINQYRERKKESVREDDLRREVREGHRQANLSNGRISLFDIEKSTRDAVRQRREGTVYADGGVANKPSVFGESGPEAAVPLPDGRNIPVTLNNDMGNKLLNDIKGLLEMMVNLNQANNQISNNANDELRKIQSSINNAGSLY